MNRRAPRVSIVIPVLNAEPYVRLLMDAILAQEAAAAEEVIFIDSNSRDRTRRIAEEYKTSRVISIDDFSHGRARNMGVSVAGGEFTVFLSQDALPADSHWLANLVASFKDEQVAAAYSRQIPNPDANPMEKFFLATRFPEERALHRRNRCGKELVLEDVFFSNVSSAVRTSVAREFPMDEDLIMSEDQKLSSDLIAAGYTVVYQPTSVVYHSHNYSLKTVFQRYFDSVYSLTQIFGSHDIATSAAMGLSYLTRETAYMLRNHPRWLPYYLCYVAAKSGGTLAGHFADHLPLSLTKRLSMHSYHWDRQGKAPDS